MRRLGKFATTLSVIATLAGLSMVGGRALAQPARDPNALSESVVASVNDEIISSYDVEQRMRLLIVTSGIQPTEQNLRQLQAQAFDSLVDERLELQELNKESKQQKFNLVAGD